LDDKQWRIFNIAQQNFPHHKLVYPKVQFVRASFKFFFKGFATYLSSIKPTAKF